MCIRDRDREVLVTVSGLLFMADEEAERQDIEVIAPGQYYWKNGKHYITYDEMAENFTEPVHNLLKISPETVSIRKKGLIETELTLSLIHISDLEAPCPAWESRSSSA